MEQQEQIYHELLRFFKALADANRLRIVGLLAQKEAYSVEELAEMLELHASTVSHHLSKLSDAGLVSARAQGYYNMYKLETSMLDKMAQRLLAEETFPKAAVGIDLNAYDHKVVRNYTDADGKLKAIPAQHKKKVAVLRYILDAFETEKRYSEKEVNEIIERFHEDYATIRREFIMNKMMDREGGGGSYWRLESEA